MSCEIKTSTQRSLRSFFHSAAYALDSKRRPNTTTRVWTVAGRGVNLCCVLVMLVHFYAPCPFCAGPFYLWQHRTESRPVCVLLGLGLCLRVVSFWEVYSEWK